MTNEAEGKPFLSRLVDRIASVLRNTDITPAPPINLNVRKMFNPNGISS